MDATEEVKIEVTDDNSDEIDDFHQEIRTEVMAEAKRNFDMLLECRLTVDRNTAYKMFQDYKIDLAEKKRYYFHEQFESLIKLTKEYIKNNTEEINVASIERPETITTRACNSRSICPFPHDSSVENIENILQITLYAPEVRIEFPYDQPHIESSVEWSLHWDPWVAKVKTKDEAESIFNDFSEREEDHETFTTRNLIHSCFQATKKLRPAKIKPLNRKLADSYRSSSLQKKICTRYVKSSNKKPLPKVPLKMSGNTEKGIFARNNAKEKEIDDRIRKAVRHHEVFNKSIIPAGKIAEMKAYSKKFAQRNGNEAINKAITLSDVFPKPAIPPPKSEKTNGCAPKQAEKNDKVKNQEALIKPDAPTTNEKIKEIENTLKEKMKAFATKLAEKK